MYSVIVEVSLVGLPDCLGIGMSFFVRMSVSLPMCQQVYIVHEEVMDSVTVPMYQRAEHLHDESQENEWMKCT